MNIYEEYLKRSEAYKCSSNEAAILFGMLNMLESEELLGPNWEKKTPEEKNTFLKDVLYRIARWQKNSPRYERTNNWEKVLEILKSSPGKRLKGFPFSKGFPKTYVGYSYEIVLVSGEILVATVDSSREFMSEGLEWKTSEGNKEQAVVAAWREKI